MASVWLSVWLLFCFSGTKNLDIVLLFYPTSGIADSDNHLDPVLVMTKKLIFAIDDHYTIGVTTRVALLSPFNGNVSVITHSRLDENVTADQLLDSLESVLRVGYLTLNLPLFGAKSHMEQYGRGDAEQVLVIVTPVQEHPTYVTSTTRILTELMDNNVTVILIGRWS